MRVFILLIIFLLFPLNFPAQKITVRALNFTQNLQITDNDKKEIVFSILRRINKDIPFFKIPEEVNLLYISKKNLPASISKDSFEKSSLINKKVQTEFISANIEDNIYDYLEFSKFEVKRNKVFVSIMLYDTHNNSIGGYYEFTKTNKKWRGKFVDGLGKSSCSEPDYPTGIITALPEIKFPSEFNDNPPQIKKP